MLVARVGDITPGREKPRAGGRGEDRLVVIVGDVTQECEGEVATCAVATENYARCGDVQRVE